MTQDPVVIELLGPPASGKSGLGAELARLPGVLVLKDHHRRDLPVLGRAAWRSRRVLLGPPTPGVSRLRWAAWAGRLGAAPSVVRRRLDQGARTVVLDQGPAYTLGRMAEVRRTPAGAAWWESRSGDCASMLDLLVVLDADEVTLTGRLRSRAKLHPAAALGDEETRGYLLRERAICRLVAETLDGAGMTVLPLDTGSTPLEDQVAAIWNALGARTTGRKSG